MHIHRVLVVKIDLHKAHGVILPWFLSIGVAVDCGRVPVDPARVEFLPTLEGLNAIFAEDILAAMRVEACFGHEIFANNTLRDMPVGIKVDLMDPAAQQRRLTVYLADHGGVARHHLVILNGLNLRCRNVDGDISFARRIRKSAQTAPGWSSVVAALLLPGR